MPFAPSQLALAAAGGVVAVVTGLATFIAGLSVEGFLSLIVALNIAEFTLILANTARISKLTGRYDATHD